MLMFGAKNPRALLLSPQCLASASCATTVPIVFTKVSFHVDPRDIGHGNTVALQRTRRSPSVPSTN